MSVKQFIFIGYLSAVERILKNALRDGPKNGWWHTKLEIALAEVSSVAVDARRGLVGDDKSKAESVGEML